MYRQFNIQQFYVLRTQCIYVFCVDLRTNGDYFLTGFYNRDGVCLLHGTDWLFKYISGLSAPLKCSSPSQNSPNTTNRTAAAATLSSSPCHCHCLPRMTKYPLQHPHLVTKQFPYSHSTDTKAELKISMYKTSQQW